MSEPRKCVRCQTYFTGLACPRCDFQVAGKQRPWQRAFMPNWPGKRRKPGDSEVRVIRPESQ